ncbi:Methyltransferase domain-containing protein [Humidesulfovibrio mexicanus]|uniref:Methyltransferase domain-containing protein n=1 Tax=Humidesulfovibrio mexicanus TaxID=147047 RepID=A0A238Y924_9BACT|nr:class I SAM-dependent methyltransferase [Humidesulfovibrio mexicanus]SNR66839.1 Methyltransferase domain-containing protein [Humidesulfovibrio mexicanus]
MALKIKPGQVVPEHWTSNDWEEKARENPLYAVMTTPDLIEADAENFSPEMLESFFAKGQRVFAKHIAPRIPLVRTGADTPYMVEYGCGMGRILKAVLEAGHPCSGIDISPTMLRHCRDLVPGVRSLHLLDENNRCDLDDACADVVFSFAVLKHIHRLSIYACAVDEMLRVLKPGGLLMLNVNCQDFERTGFDNPHRTENFEEYSLHFEPGKDKPYQRRAYTTWSGVYIGYDWLKHRLDNGGVSVLDTYYHTLKKKQGIWLVGTKGDSRPFSSAVK